MRIAVTTPSGHVGSKVAQRLLSSGAKVVLLARDPSKLQEFVRAGAEVRQGSLDDAEFVTNATSAMDALFWVTPPDPKAEDCRFFQNACGQAAAEAILTNQIPRVVNLSSVGAQLSEEAGLISGLHDVEEILDAVAENIVHLRAGWFFENFLMPLEAGRDASSISMPVDPSVHIPMIATRDIASTASDLLLDSNWQGQHVLGLHGPADLTLTEAAEQISRGLGRTIRYVQVGEDQVRSWFTAMGASEDFIDSLLEMDRGFSSGYITTAEPRTPETTTSTTLERFAREEIAPRLVKGVQAAE